MLCDEDFSLAIDDGEQVFEVIALETMICLGTSSFNLADSQGNGKRAFSSTSST